MSRSTDINGLWRVKKAMVIDLVCVERDKICDIDMPDTSAWFLVEVEFGYGKYLNHPQSAIYYIYDGDDIRWVYIDRRHIWYYPGSYALYRGDWRVWPNKYRIPAPLDDEISLAIHHAVSNFVKR